MRIHLAVVDGALHVIGGMSSPTPKYAERYDPVADRWSDALEMAPPYGVRLAVPPDGEPGIESWDGAKPRNILFPCVCVAKCPTQEFDDDDDQSDEEGGGARRLQWCRPAHESIYPSMMHFDTFSGAAGSPSAAGENSRFEA